jgi:opacity protein-like surface antigen
MKRILSTLAVLLVSFTMNAQGYIGGEIGFSHLKNNSDKSKTTTFVLKPDVGFKVNDTWSIGATVGFEFARQKDDQNYCVDANSLELSPYVRCNAFKAGIFTFFIDATASIITMKTDKNWEEDGTESYSGWSVGLCPGISVAITDNVSLVAHTGGIGYFDTTDINNLEGFTMDINTSNLTFGFLVNF